MKLRMLSILSVALIVGCGKSLQDVISMGKKPYSKSKTNEVFRPYIRSFVEEFNVSVRVPIVLKKLHANKAGVCLVWSDGYREIQINSTHWQFFTEEQKEQLVFHELGHCVFDLDHDDSLMPNNSNCPNSIMRSFMFSPVEGADCYVPEYQHYVEDINAKR
jgi:hypothetical protein